MGMETIGEYEIEYAGVHLVEQEGWAAYVTVYGPSTNPMHRNSIFPTQRVSLESVFASEAEAEAEARRVAHAMVEQANR
ncbi:hypothetical protein [Noviherbaspirillum sp. UKPF54]|uniref:hypothetical protein n=1 Tax=Noviherbaspirillum sp. UKPF54 TaxID=2601898 RepID=UPI0011B128C7|nr:hypothetical protein [Noviherbaspirillum sp. UKPF54]QDZ30053.1 hypothetical protein FAY22_20050 [Noviherbaspirillum sp. UKPF54]